MAYTDKDYALERRLRHDGIRAGVYDAHILRRAEMTLSRWAEAECGSSNQLLFTYIERDEVTGKPFRYICPHNGTARRYPIPDREAGALQRVSALCKELGLHFYHQTDPRGCTLYVAAEPLTDQNYSTQGVACCD